MASYKGVSRYSDKGRGDLSADDWNWLQTQRRQIEQQYSLGTAQNKFQRDTAKANYLRRKGDLTRSWAQRFADFQAPYVRAGLLNSGLYALGRDRFNLARNQQLGELLADYEQTIGALKLSDELLASVRRNALDDIASAEAARRASVAEELRRARQGL